jgi:peptidoglycan hydrolase-like protein with peptidoglycan-binding domain
MMPNLDLPIIRRGATAEAVQRLQRALRRIPDFEVTIDGIFGPQLEARVKLFQEGSGIAADGIVGPETWVALPDGGPMPVLEQGSSGAVVERLQRVLTDKALGQWNTTPGGIDGKFGPGTKASVEAFQAWAGAAVSGVVESATWSASLRGDDATLESAVGLDFITA